METNAVKNGIFDLAIIGGGPAGLAAAAYGLNAGLHVALIAPDLGGKVAYPFELLGQPPTDTVWGAELVHQFERYVETHLNSHFETTVQKVRKLADGHFQLLLDAAGQEGGADTLIARTVLVATGAKPQQLHIPGEKELWMRGVSYSALSHAPLFGGRDALVVGRGERALVATLQLAMLANHVYLAPTVAFKAGDTRLTRIRQDPKISLLEGWQLQRIVGTDYVTQAELAQGYTTHYLAVDGVFIELGLIPNQEFVRDLVEFDAETGRILVNQRCETSVPGLYAAGDVTNIYAEQVPIAIGEGTKAALGAWEYLVTKYDTQLRAAQTAPHAGGQLMAQSS